MTRRQIKLYKSRRKLHKLVFIAVFIVISLSAASIPLSHEMVTADSLLDNPSSPTVKPQSSNLFENGILYTGIQDSLSINETAIHSSTQHYKIGDGTFTGYSTQNAEFPIDTTHNWEGYFYNSTITNIHDERDWVENGDIGSDSGLIGVDQTILGTPVESAHDYANNENPNPNSPDGIIVEDSDFIRVHYDRLEFEEDWDYLYVYDQNNAILDIVTGFYADIWSSWYNASTVKFCIESDGLTREYGFYIDEYEEYNITTWTAYEASIDPEYLRSTVSEIGGESSIGGFMLGNYDGEYYRYEESEVGFYQMKDIPRGKVVDATFSLDYYLKSGIDTNDFSIYCKINGDMIYSRGFGTINTAGKNTWHSSGDINMVLWQNTSVIFNPVVSGQVLNISVGIISNTDAGFSGFEDEIFQEAYVDNVELVLKTEANGTQSDINLQFDSLSIIDSSDWGTAEFSRYNTWDSNPMQISLSTDAPKLEFDLDSEVYGYHPDSTHEQDNGQSGSHLTILTNKTIQWESYHNVFVPSQYADFEYGVYKPNDWEIIQVEDPTGLPYEGYLDGGVGDNSFTIESDFPGWWYFVANSSNRLISSSTDLWDDATWKDYDGGDVSYDIGENIRIRTDLTNPSQIGNILTSEANLTIYYPNETIFNFESTNPDGTGYIQFSDININAIDTVGGLYHYRIVWTNGTSAGGLNGTFEIKHNIQHTVSYPRDAITNFETEAISGDVIPIRIILNDSDTGDMLSNLNVEFNWTSTNYTLNEISSGIYDTSLDTLDLSGSGDYTVEFTISGDGFYNVYFTLTIHLVSETELKIIGLDNNIDYGTNFTIRLDYYEKPTPLGITNAQISLNMTEYHVTEDVTDGEYTVVINSSSSFPGPGTFDIQINATSSGHISQELVTRIQILPRAVYFQILIDSSDCTTNKSYAAKIQDDLNFTIGVYTSFGDLPVLTGTVQLSDGLVYSPAFTIVGDQYYSLIDSSFFGLGVNFISLIFNETGYQSASEILQISITRINVDIEFQDTDTMLVTKRDEFSTQLYLEDPRTLTPILNATVSYSWTFGTGFLTEIGGGYYEFSETAPTQIGQYEVTFTVTTADPDYESQTISMTLVIQQPDSPINWWWIIAAAGLVVAILSGSLIAIGVKNKRTKNRAQEIAKLQEKTQIFDDITNIKGILLIEKNSGLLMYKHVLSGLDQENEELFSGFIRAILLLGKRFIRRDADEIEKGMVFEKEEFIEFTHENFKVLLAGGHKIIVALILEEQASEAIKEKASKFIEEFEGIYASVLDGWTGNRGIFSDTTPKLFEEIFSLSLLRAFHLSDNCEIYAKKFIPTNSISERVSIVIQTLQEEKETFHLKTIISLIPEEDKLAAKDVILKFIKGRYVIPKK